MALESLEDRRLLAVDHLTVALQFPTVTAGASLLVTVRAVDAFGVTDPSYRGAIHLSTTDAQAAVPVTDYTFTAGDNGVHSFSFTFKTAGTQNVVATDIASPTIIGQAGGVAVTELAPGAAPFDITSGPDGNLWYVDFGSNQVVKLSTSGVTTGYAIPTSNSGPQEITTGPDGNLWFTESNVDKIGRINPSTGVITEFSAGITPGSSPFAITAGPDGNLWFTEWLQDRIARITPSGTVTEFAIPNPASGRPAPSGIVAGPDGNLWFTETGASLIGQLTPAGVFTTFALPAPNSSPNAITAGPDGNLWFTEQQVNGVGGNRIGRITPFGALTEYTIPTANSNSLDIAAGPDGNLWFTEFDNGKVGYINPVQGQVFEVAAAAPNSWIQSITGGPDGNLWFTEYNKGKVGKIMPQFVVTPAATQHLSVSAPPTVIANQPFVFTVTARDQFNNMTPGFIGPVTISSVDGSASLPPGYSFVTGDRGVHVFGATLRTLGQKNIQAAASGSVVSGSQAINVTQTATWIGPASGGDWSTAANWSTGVVPNADTQALIPTGFSVGHTGNTFDDVYGLVVQAGSSLNIVAGAITVRGGTSNPGTAISTINGAVNLGGPTTSGGGRLVVFGSQGLLTGTGTIVFSPSLNNELGMNGTIDTGITVRGQHGAVDAPAGGFVWSNRGTIVADTADAGNGGISVRFTGSGGTGANSGTIKAIGGGTIVVGVSSDFVNTGLLQADGSGSTFAFGATGPSGNATNTWTSTNGNISLINNARLVLGNRFTQADLAHFTRAAGTTVDFRGVLVGGLTLTDALGAWNLSGGLLQGGTFQVAPGSAPATQLFATGGDGTLAGVTLNSPINLATKDSQNAMPRLTVISNLTLNTLQSVGSADGTVFGTIAFNNTSPPTFTEIVNGTGGFVFGGHVSNSFNTGLTSLIFGPSITVSGKSGQITAPLELQGTIDANVAGGTITVQGNWTNAGTVRAHNGGTFVSASIPTNLSSGTLTGGSWEAYAASTVKIASGASVTTNAASLVFDGVGATMFSGNGGNANLQTTLTTNAAAGTFSVRNGAAFSAPNFTNTGTLNVLTGASFSSPGVAPTLPGVSPSNRWTGDNTTFDSAGFNNGTAFNGATFGPGQIGQAFSFNGNNSYVQFSPILFNTNNFSVTFWIKTASTAAQVVLGNRVDFGNGNYFSVRMNQGKIGAEIDAGGGTSYVPLSSNRVISDGRFHAVSVVRSGTNFTLYIDGQFDVSGSSGVVTNLNVSHPLLLGWEPVVATLPALNGLLDDVTVYNGTALNAAQVQAVYDAGLGTFTQTGGTTTVDGTLQSGPGTGAILINGGIVGGAGTLSGNVTNAATIAPAGAGTAGILTIAGNYSQLSGGTLAVDVGGNTAGSQFDRLAVSGTAIVAGTIRGTLINGYALSLANPTSAQVLTAGARIGLFSTLDMPTSGNFTLNPSYQPSGVTLLSMPIGTTVYWTNPAGGDWSNPANWSTGAVPTSSDTVYISVPSGVTVAVSDNETAKSLAANARLVIASTGHLTLGIDPSEVTTLRIEGGTLTATGTLSVIGSLFWSGRIDGGGTIDAIGGMTIVNTFAAGNHVILAGSGTTPTTVINEASATWSSADIQIPDNSQFINNGTMSVTSTGFFQGPTINNPAGRFTNNGTFAADPGAGQTMRDLGVLFDSTGSVILLSGAMYLDGGTFSGSASLVGNAGTTIGINGRFTFQPGTNLSGDTIAFQDWGGITGPVQIQGSYSTQALTRVISGEVDFNGASINIASQLTIDANATANFTQAAPGTLNVYFATIQGTFTGNASLNVATTMNLQGAVLTTSGTVRSVIGSIQNQLLGTSNLTINGLFLSNAILNTSGTIDVLGSVTISAGCAFVSGVLNLHGGADMLGNVDVSGGFVINNFAGSQFNIFGGPNLNHVGSTYATFNNDGTVTQTLSIDTSTFEVNFVNSSTGVVHVQNGVLELGMGAPGGVTNAGSIVVDAGRTLTMSSYTDTGGSLALAGGTVRIGNASGFGTFGGITPGGVGGVGTGSTTLVIAGGTLSGYGDIFADVQNAGTVAPGGTGATSPLVIHGNYIQTTQGTLEYTLGGTVAVTDYGRLDVDNAVTLGGTLEVSLATGFTPAADDSFLPLLFGSRPGLSNFATTILPAGLTTVFNANNLLLTPPATESGSTVNIGPSDTTLDLSGSTQTTTVVVEGSTDPAQAPTVFVTGTDVSTIFVLEPGHYANATFTGGPAGSTNNFQVAPSGNITVRLVANDGATNILDVRQAVIPLTASDKPDQAVIDLGATIDLSQNNGQSQHIYDFNNIKSDVSFDTGVVTSNGSSALSLTGQFSKVVAGSGATLYAAGANGGSSLSEGTIGSQITLTGTGNKVFAPPGTVIQAYQSGNQVIQTLAGETASQINSYLAANPTDRSAFLTRNPAGFSQYVLANTTAREAFLAPNRTNIAAYLSKSPAAIDGFLLGNTTAVAQYVADNFSSGFASLAGSRAAMSQYLVQTTAAREAYLRQNTTTVAGYITSNATARSAFLQSDSAGLTAYIGGNPAALSAFQDLFPDSTAFILGSPTGLQAYLAAHPTALEGYLVARQAIVQQYLASRPTNLSAYLLQNSSALASYMTQNKTALAAFIASSPVEQQAYIGRFSEFSGLAPYVASDATAQQAFLVSNSAGFGAYIASNSTALAAFVAAYPDSASYLGPNGAGMQAYLRVNPTAITGFLIGRSAVLQGYLHASATVVQQYLAGSPDDLSAYITQNATGLAAYIVARPAAVEGYLQANVPGVAAFLVKNTGALSAFLEARPDLSDAFLRAGTAGIEAYLRSNLPTLEQFANANLDLLQDYIRTNTTALVGFIPGDSDILGGYLSARPSVLQQYLLGNPVVLQQFLVGNLPALQEFLTATPDLVGRYNASSADDQAAYVRANTVGLAAFITGNSAALAAFQTQFPDAASYLVSGGAGLLAYLRVNTGALGAYLTAYPPALSGYIGANPTTLDQFLAASSTALDQYVTSQPTALLQYLTDSQNQGLLTNYITANRATLEQFLIANRTALEQYLVASGTPLEQYLTQVDATALDTFLEENPGVLAQFLSDNPEVLQLFLSSAGTDAQEALITSVLLDMFRIKVDLPGPDNHASGGFLSSFNLGPGSSFNEVIDSNQLSLLAQAIASGVSLDEYAVKVHISGDAGDDSSLSLVAGGLLGDFTIDSGRAQFVLQDPALLGVPDGAALPAEVTQRGGKFTISTGASSFSAVGGSSRSFGPVTIAAPANAGPLALDFSSFQGGGIHLDLNATGTQTVSPALLLTLPAGLTISKVVGSPGSDTIIGNGNGTSIIGSVQHIDHPNDQPAPSHAPVPVQWVYLDFNHPSLGPGETLSQQHDAAGHITAADQSRIQTALETIYDSFKSYVKFTRNLNDLAQVPAYITVFFDVTPFVDNQYQPGGHSSEIDFGNLNLGTTVDVDINPFLGAGSNQVPDTPDNFRNLMTTVAAHEIAHTLGVRHGDAFGPIGYGISNPPGLDNFYPTSAGAVDQVNAFETVRHIIASPASVGSTLEDAASGQAEFGEREAVKLAFIAGGTTVAEANGPHAGLNSPQPLGLYTLAVPNPVAAGFDAGKSFDVAAVSVTGSLAGTTAVVDASGLPVLDPKTHAPLTVAQPDVYTFFGQAGDVMNFEVMSAALTRIRDAFDTVIRVYDPDKVLIATNDDAFEPSDSSIIDLVLTKPGAYYVEVDSYHSTDPSLLDPSSSNYNLPAYYHALKGDYDLFMYRFAAYDAQGGSDSLFSAPPTLDFTGPLPPKLTGSTVATFSYAMTNNITPQAGLSFRGVLDGVVLDSTSGPVQLKDLNNGQHSFLVQNVDAGGNVIASSAAYTWTVDAQPPVVTLAVHTSSDPTRPTFSGQAGTQAASSSSSADATTVTIEISSGGQVVRTLVAPVAADGSFSVVPTTPLAQGSYTARALQSDGVGNVGQSPGVSFTVASSGDTTPPTVSFTSVPPVFTNLATATFNYSATDPLPSPSGFARVDLSLDGQPYASSTSATGPLTLTGLSQGAHTFSIQAYDRAGNASTIVSYTWNIGSVYVLNRTQAGALSLSGNATLTVPGLVEVDSSSSTAVTASGNAKVSAGSIRVVGGVQTSGNASLKSTPATHTPFVADPLASLPVPDTSGPNIQPAVSLSGNTTKTISPGIYPQISVSGNAKLTLNPGIYIIKGGGLTVTGNGSIAGSDVLIYNAGSSVSGTGASYGGVTLSGKGTIDLSPMTSGPYAGILLFQSRDNTRAMSLDGNAALSLHGGTIYAPAALLTVSGNAEFSGPVLVDRLQLTGNGGGSALVAAGLGTEADASAGELLAGDLQLFVGAGLSEDELARVSDAVSNWAKVLAPYSVTITIVTSADEANLVLVMSEASENGGQAQGVLGSYASGAITIVMGWRFYTGGDPSGIGADEFDFESLVAHELGHALGLGHSPSADSVMFASLVAGRVRRDPSVADLNIREEHQGAGPDPLVAIPAVVARPSFVVASPTFGGVLVAAASPGEPASRIVSPSRMPSVAMAGPATASRLATRAILVAPAGERPVPERGLRAWERALSELAPLKRRGLPRRDVGESDQSWLELARDLLPADNPIPGATGPKEKPQPANERKAEGEHREERREAVAEERRGADLGVGIVLALGTSARLQAKDRVERKRRRKLWRGKPPV